jgi:hypothetical protein
MINMTDIGLKMLKSRPKLVRGLCINVISMMIALTNQHFGLGPLLIHYSD